jgi:threonine dehydrogenase-like Zn-dependent dehydrogenase
MNALVLEDAKKFAFREVDRPELATDRDVLVRVKAVGICGSDVHGMDGSTGRRRPPIIMGHEASGVIEAVGAAVRDFHPGQRVTFDSTMWCGECYYCRSGRVNLCDHRRVLGVSCEEYRQDGAFAEFVVVPDRILFQIPDALDFVGAALTEPVAVAAHAANLTPIERNETLVVVGAGLIGLLLLQVLRSGHSGRIIAVDLDASRLELARKLGADEALLATDPDLEARILDLTSGRGADRAFEAVGATAPIKTALSLVRKGGSLTLIGNLSPKIELPLQTVVTRELTLYGSCAIAGEYPLALDLMARRKLDYAAVVSAVRPLSEGASWFDRLYNREPGLLKVVLEP